MFVNRKYNTTHDARNTIHVSISDSVPEQKSCVVLRVSCIVKLRPNKSAHLNIPQFFV